jgi:hypothetical protein
MTPIHCREPRGGDQAKPVRPHLVEPKIANHEYRRAHIKAPEEGLFCVSIEAGEELGELYFNTQFEAQPDEPDAHELCNRGQNRVLIETSDFLKDFLEEISAGGVDWEATIITTPCDKTQLNVDRVLAQNVLEGKVTVEQALKEVAQSAVKVEEVTQSAVENKVAPTNQIIQ